MLWHVRVLLEDRPGALAALAQSCGQQAVNVLGLEVHPYLDGRVVDELVLHTADGWTEMQVERVVRQAGVLEADVAQCSPHVLEDQPVRYMRAAQRVMQDPLTLDRELRRLLDAATGPHTLVLDDGEGPRVVLNRSVPFTDTEAARARELRRLAEVASLSAAPVPVHVPVPAAGDRATLRRGTEADVAALIAMHGRCSAETVHRRFHSPMPRLTEAVARVLLEPTDGFSLVLTTAQAVIGCGTVARTDGSYEVGLLVEDGWQGKGHGTRLLAGLAEEARKHGARSLTCHVQPGNQAVPATIQRAGLHARAAHSDGVNVYSVAVDKAIPTAALPRRRLTRGSTLGKVTTPLVHLLHERPELRQVCPAADLLDQAVRGGA